MRNAVVLALASTVLSVVTIPVAYAQKGVGDQTGVARQPVQPQVVALSGKLVEIRIGLCEKTTGRAAVGTHLFLETPDGKSLNIHLGPAAAVADIVAKLSTRENQDLTVKAFRTEKMPENHYVAQSLTFDANTIELRDKTLRPVWAGKANVSRGRGASQGGRRGLGAPLAPK
jgi:hypothetical protein